MRRRLLRNELRRAVTALSNAAAATAKTRDTTPGKDPDSDIVTEMIAAADQGGFPPNRVLFGETARTNAFSPTAPRRARADSPSPGSPPMNSPTSSGVDGLRVSRERFQSTAAAKSKITGDFVLLFVGQDDAVVDDPTHAKRFWTPVEGGGKYRVYEHQVSAKHIDLTVEHYSNTIITSTLGLRKITV